MSKLQKRGKQSIFFSTTTSKVVTTINSYIFKFERHVFRQSSQKKQFCHILLFYYFENALNNQGHQYFHFNYTIIIRNEWIICKRVCIHDDQRSLYSTLLTLLIKWDKPSQHPCPCLITQMYSMRIFPSEEEDGKNGMEGQRLQHIFHWCTKVGLILIMHWTTWA